MKFSAERTPADNTAERPILQRQLAAYYKSLEYIEGCRVLEIGCGEGIGASLLASKAGSVVALDYSENALLAARTGYSTDAIEFILMKVPPIEFEDMSFDSVVCFQMIEHLKEPHDLMVEIKRVLRDRGTALIATVNGDETITDNPYHLHEFSAEGFEKLLKTHFHVVEMYGVFGDELFLQYWHKNRKWANTFLRADIFNVSNRLPRVLRQRLFDAASRVMRFHLKHRDPDLCQTITHENFMFRPNEFAGSLDFFAVCRKVPIL